MIPTFIYKWLSGLAFAIVLCAGSVWWGYDHGESAQKAVYAAAQAKANAVVVKKNTDSQKVADKVAQVQVVYKDRIVTKYQTVTKDVIKYVETPAASVGLDPEFVRLHNVAASANNTLPIAQSSSGVDGTSSPVGVTTGEAIGVITRNYQAYYECKRQVDGWIHFYSGLQNTVNEDNSQAK